MSVSLIKGQKISLDKEAGVVLSKVTVGLGWDVAMPTGAPRAVSSKDDDDDDDDDDVDLDVSCILFDDANRQVDVVWFCQLKSKDGSVVHTGDNVTGDGDGDDEQINVNLGKVPANVKSLVFTVNSFSGQAFAQVQNAYCRIVNADNGREVARFNLSVQGEHTAQVMAKLYRHNGEWKMHAIGENSAGMSFQQLLPNIIPYL